MNSCAPILLYYASYKAYTDVFAAVIIISDQQQQQQSRSTGLQIEQLDS